MQKAFTRTAVKAYGALTGQDDEVTDVVANVVSSNYPSLFMPTKTVAETEKMATKQLGELEEEMLPTRGLFESIEKGDVLGTAAAMVNAGTAVLSTATSAILTAGVGLYTDLVGQSLYDYNKAKADALKIDIDKLYETGNDDVAVPVIIGTAAAMLEKTGLEGISKAINRNISKAAVRETIKFSNDLVSEGWTELLQFGLDAVNKAAAEGKDVDELGGVFVDAITSKEGIESGLNGLVGSGVSVATGKAAKGLYNYLSPARKKNVLSDYQVAEAAANDLRNPELTPEKAQVVLTIAKDATDKIKNEAFEQADENLRLNEDEATELSEANHSLKVEQDAVSVFEGMLQDESVSEETKNAIKGKIESAKKIIQEIGDRIDGIYDKAKARGARVKDFLRGQEEARVTEMEDFYKSLKSAESPTEEDKKILSIGDITELFRRKKESRENVKKLYEEAKRRGQIKALEKEEQRKLFIQEQRKNRDLELEEIAKMRPDLTDSDLLLIDLPDSVDKVLDRVDANIPSDPVAISEAIDALDKKFDALEAYKNDPKRTHTIKQIDEVIDALSDAKSTLQFYDNENKEYRETKGKPKIPAAQVVAPEQEEIGVRLPELVEPQAGEAVPEVAKEVTDEATEMEDFYESLKNKKSPTELGEKPLLTPKQEQDAKEQQGRQMRDQGKQGEAEGLGNRNLPEGDRAQLQDGQKAEEVDSEREQLLMTGEAEERRTKGRYTKDGIEYVRQKEDKGIRGKQGEVRFAKNVVVKFTYKLIEAKRAQASHKQGIRNPLFFIPEAQPKNRTDKESIAAEQNFAYNPRFGELGYSNIAYEGAPTVNKRDEGIQGHNRLAGIRLGYELGQTKYKEELAKNAEQFGFTEDQVMSMEEPMLVRELDVTDDYAIELGNYVFQDVETGGDARIQPARLIKRIPVSKKVMLLGMLTGDDTINGMLRKNFNDVFSILNPYLNSAQKMGLKREDGTPKPSAIEDLESLVLQFLFDGGDVQLNTVFENLPYYMREGIVKSLRYLLESNKEKSLLPDVQEALIILRHYEMSGSGNFDAFLNQYDAYNNVTPSSLYSPVSIAIAKRILSEKKISAIPPIFAEYKRLVTDKPGDMYEEATKGVSKAEAIKTIFNIDYEEQSKPKEQGGPEGGYPKAGEQAVTPKPGEAEPEAKQVKPNQDEQEAEAKQEDGEPMPKGVSGVRPEGKAGEEGAELRPEEKVGERLTESKNQKKFFKRKPNSRDLQIIDIDAVRQQKPKAFEFLSKYKGHESFSPQEIRNVLAIAYNKMMRYKVGAENLVEQISQLEDIVSETYPVREVSKEEFKKQLLESGDFNAEQLEIFYALVDSLNIDKMPEYNSNEASLAFVGIKSKNFYSFSDNITSAKNPESFIHEIGHFAFYNILSKQDRLDYLKYMIGSTYGTNAKSLSERIALTSEKIEGEIDGKKVEHSTNVADNFSEYFAEQFRQWYLKEKTTPKQFDSIFEKVQSFFEKFFEKLKSGDFIDRGLVKYFDKIIKASRSPEEKVGPSGPVKLGFSAIDDMLSLPKDEYQKARNELKTKYGAEKVADMIAITRKFEQIITGLEQANKIRKECP
jgi:hypothetical protein